MSENFRRQYGFQQLGVEFKFGVQSIHLFSAEMTPWRRVVSLCRSAPSVHASLIVSQYARARPGTRGEPLWGLPNRLWIAHGTNDTVAVLSQSLSGIAGQAAISNAVQQFRN